jgi:hypothetical protein
LENLRIPSNSLNLVVTVPSHLWLYSDYDSSIGHFKRYTKRQLTAEFVAAGFRVTHSQFMFQVFVLPAFILRRIPYLIVRKRSVDEVVGGSRLQERLSGILSPLLKLTLWFESRMPLLMGLSIVLVGTKPDSR